MTASPESNETKSSLRTPKVAVLGGSIAGLMATIVLAKKGFKVSLFEKRETYTRNIQWGVRQSFLDYLAGANENIAAEFFDKLASRISNGYRFLAESSSLHKEGICIRRERSSPRRGVFIERDLCAASTLGEEIVCLVPAKILETFLCDQIRRLPGVDLIHKAAPPVRHNAVSDCYYLEHEGGQLNYDLIVVAEGASSSTKEAAGIKSMNVTRSVPQVSGEVYLKKHGMITEYLHASKRPGSPREEFLLSLMISTGRHNTSWIAGDVSSECLKKLSQCPPDGQARTDILEAEFRKIAARTMLDAEQSIVDAGYRGSVQAVKMFMHQARISNKAIAGRNLVLAGDAVGVGHWSVGGGMHVAAICHCRRLEALAETVLTNSIQRGEALKTYNEGALADTIEWISRGIGSYYLAVPDDVLRDVFAKLIVEAMKDNSIDIPQQLRERVTAIYFDP